MPPTLRRDIFFDSLQLRGEDRVHAGDRGDKAPGLAALQAPLTAGAAPALPQRVLLASGSQSAPPAPRISSPRSPDTAPVAGPRPEGCPGRAEEPGSPHLPPLFLAILGVSERGAMARHLPPCTGPFWRTCSLPQTFFSPHGRDETLMQEGAEREQPVWERASSLFLLGSCNCSLEVREATGFGPKMETCSSRHFVSATARFSYSCAEPSVRSSVLWKLPEKDITDVKGRQGEYILASTRARCFNRGYFGSSLDCPISLLGPLFSWSGCCPCFLVKGWPRRRWRPREALLPPWDNLTLLTNELALSIAL